MDSSSAIQLCRLNQPQIKSCKVTERHCQSEKVLLERPCLIVKRLLLLLKMLFYKAFLVVIEVLEYEGLVSRDLSRSSLLSKWRLLQARERTRAFRNGAPGQVEASQLLKVAGDLLFVVLQCIEGVEEGHHGLGKHGGIADVNLHQKSEGYVVEHVFFQPM